jgi:Flp pilus assembly pilin Flp
VFRRILTCLFSWREEGAAVTEYAVALLLIVVLTIALISLLGGSISSFFQSASNTI